MKRKRNDRIRRNLLVFNENRRNYPKWMCCWTGRYVNWSCRKRPCCTGSCVALLLSSVGSQLPWSLKVTCVRRTITTVRSAHFFRFWPRAEVVYHHGNHVCVVQTQEDAARHLWDADLYRLFFMVPFYNHFLFLHLSSLCLLLASSFCQLVIVLPSCLSSSHFSPLYFVFSGFSVFTVTLVCITSPVRSTKFPSPMSRNYKNLPSF